MPQRQLGRPEQDRVGRLDAQHERVVLVAHLVLPAAEPPAGPDGAPAEPGQGGAQGRVPPQGGRGVAVLEPAVVEGDDLVLGGQEAGRDGAAQRVCDDGGPRLPLAAFPAPCCSSSSPCPCPSSDGDGGAVDGLEVGLGDLEH